MIQKPIPFRTGWIPRTVWVHGFRLRLPSNRKHSYSFLLTVPGQPPCSVFTIPQVRDGQLSFWGGRGLDSFQKLFLYSKNRWKKTSCKGRHGKKIGHVLSALQLLFLMLSPKNTMHKQEEVKKKQSRPKNYPYFPPQKKWFVFCHVVIMKGYSQFAS